MKYVKLNSICNFKQWHTIPTKELKDSGYPVYGANGIIGFSDKYNHDEPTIMICCRGATCGAINVSQRRCYINGNAMSMDNLSKEFDIDFVVYYLKYYDFSSIITGAAQPQITQKGLEKVMIPSIPLSEQKKIVKDLNSIDEIIKSIKLTLSSLDEIIKSQFIEMFASSKEMKVEEVCSSFKIGPFGSALHKNEISNSGYAFVLGTDNAVKNEFAFKEIRYINEEKFKQLEKYTVDKDDIIMSMMGTVGRVALIPEKLGRAIISSHLCILKVNKSLMYPDFFHVAFSQDDDIQQQIEGIHNGSIMKGFNLKIVKSFKMKCPSLPEQLHFINLKKQIDKSKFIWISDKKYI